MMKRPTVPLSARRVRRALGRLGLPLGAAVLLAATSMPTIAQGQTVPSFYGVTANNQLVRFGGTTPGTISSTADITGLQGGESIVGIDVRPANGRLYGVGSTGNLYTIDPTSGAATRSGTSALSLTGAAFGVDFNPVPDRLRVVSDGDQNLRINVDTVETTVDGTLKYAPGDVNASANPVVVAAGYTNSVAGAQSTSLFVIDAGLDILARQDPPNDGVLNTIGKLGVDVTDVAGFDVAPDGNRAYAALNRAGGSSTDLYWIDLATGTASRVGPIGSGQPIRGLAAILPAPGAGAQPAPAAKPAGQMQMPSTLPRAGEAEDRTTVLMGLATIGAGLLLAGSRLVLRRRRA
jgi:hypothetical protein